MRGVLGCHCVHASNNTSLHSLDTFSSVSRGTKSLLAHEVPSTESCRVMLAGDLACVIIYLSPNRGAVFTELSAVVCVCCPKNFICSVHNCSKQAVVIELSLSFSFGSVISFPAAFSGVGL